MKLMDVIVKLMEYPAEQVVTKGFGEPDSYRGYYEDVAFTPVDNTTVGEMRNHAISALDETFNGYKGGSYKMDKNTNVWLAEYGHEGEELGPTLLGYMLGDFR